MKASTFVRVVAFVGLVTSISISSAQIIPGSYIAVLQDNVPDPAAAARAMAAQHGVTVSHVYQHAIRGFAFTGPPQAAAALSRRPNIRFVEQDQVFEAWAETIPTGISRAAVPEVLANGSGSSVNVDIAIIDTGIQQSHPDLNVVGGIRYYTQGLRLRSDGNWNDGNGHGTHVAGTAAARNQGSGVAGVAPGARLWAVKVLGDNGSGSTTAVIAGVDWVRANAGTIEVANMSLGGGYSQAVNDAVRNTVAAGVVVVVAAGNEGTLAATKSPAAEPAAITVSALADSDGSPGGLGSATGFGADDTFATFSNYGSVVDICAPGVDILSTYLNGQYAIGSGTSMASPHVAGAAALYIAENGLTKNAAGVEAVASALKNAGWQDGDTEYFDGDPDGIAEPLLNVGALVSSPPPDDPPVNDDPAITLSASAYKVKGQQKVDLVWSGATGSSVDVYRNGVKLTTTSNDGAYTDNINKNGGGTYTFYLKSVPDGAVSNEAIVSFN